MCIDLSWPSFVLVPSHPRPSDYSFKMVSDSESAGGVSAGGVSDTDIFAGSDIGVLKAVPPDKDTDRADMPPPLSPLVGSSSSQLLVCNVVCVTRSSNV